MEKVEFLTSQNVLIEQDLAGLWDRIAAFLIDMLVVLAYITIVNMVLGLVGISWGPVKIMFQISVVLYPLLMENFANGQTVGKQQLKIRVVKMNGNQCSFADYLLRWVFLPLDLVLMGGIAIVLIWLRGKGQRLGDIVAGTTVVKVGKKTQTLRFQETGKEYNPVFPEVVHLSTHDMVLIRQTLKVFRESGNRAPLEKLDQKIREHLQVESDLPPAKFLVTILKDFSHLSR